MTDREEYEAAIARNNELRRKLKSMLMQRNRVPHMKATRFDTIVERIRRQIEQHSNLIAELEANLNQSGLAQLEEQLSYTE